MGRLNKNPLTEIVFNSFGGGYAGAKAIGNLKPNEAQDLDNVVILPQGSGIRNVEGTKQISPTGGSTHNLWNKTIGVLATKITLSGNTGLKVITLAETSSPSGGDEVDILQWNIDDKSIAAHGRLFFTGTAIDANTEFSIFEFRGSIIVTTDIPGTISGGDSMPVKLSSGEILSALQTGVAPQGKIGIGWNNVCWIGNTPSEKSKLFYSVVVDETDWNGSGSGFVNPDPDDGDELIAVTPVSNNVMLYFKARKIYQIVGRADPFAIFELFRNVGCVGKDALVNIDGVVYFITPSGQMRITDGSKIFNEKDIPALSNADDLWSQIPVSRRPFIRGVRHKGRDYDWIIWMVSLGSSQTTNNQAIIWDITNQCWLQHTKGFAANHMTSNAGGRTFLGSYDSARIFEVAVTDYHKDDTDSTAIFDGNQRLIAPTDSKGMSWFWRTDDFTLQSLQGIIQIDRVNVLLTFDGTGVFRISYGYDGFRDQRNIDIPFGSELFLLGTSILGEDLLGGSKFRITSIRPLGRGNTTNLKFASSSEVNAKIAEYTLAGRQQGTKVSEVR